MPPPNHLRAYTCGECGIQFRNVQRKEGGIDLYLYLLPTYAYLIMAATCFSGALIWTFTGKRTWIFRADDLARYRWGVGGLYLGGVLSIFIFLFRVHAL